VYVLFKMSLALMPWESAVTSDFELAEVTAGLCISIRVRALQKQARAAGTSAGDDDWVLIPCHAETADALTDAVQLRHLRVRCASAHARSWPVAIRSIAAARVSVRTWAGTR
jgi:hypothetical protein